MRKYFKAESGYDGSNWLIAEFGTDTSGKTWVLTTNNIHASDLNLYSGGAGGDCKLVAELLDKHFNNIDTNEENAHRGLTLATLCDMVLGEDAEDRSDEALLKAVRELLNKNAALVKSILQARDCVFECDSILTDALK